MTVEQLAKLYNFNIITMPCPEKEICGAYIGDLLSWVMGKVCEGDIWITIMSNVNVIAVASLTDCATILLAEDVKLDEDVIKVAKSKNINVLSTALSAYQASVALSKYLNE